ncbi:MAG: mannose-1-phosphate guanylyltransferase [Pseudomonadota bacterium]
MSLTNQDTFIIVLAGGQGSRFWPLSRCSRPKQFLSMSGDGESLIQATVRRVSPLVVPERVLVVASERLMPLVREHVPHAGVVIEPEARNTAACIGLAAVAAAVKDSQRDPVLVVLPADHAVSEEQRLIRALQEAIDIARSSDSLVTIGIPPTTPHTGYGYIKRGEPLSGRAYHVDRFFEKPNLQRARRYLEQGGYSWNSGMFVWRASVILDAFKEHMPEMYQGLELIRCELEAGQQLGVSPSINSIFAQLEAISVDFGVLEHARNCVVIDAEPFGWNDVGSWDQWAENFVSDENGNLIHGEAVVIDSTGCVVRSEGRLVAAVGLEDVVIVDSGDAILVVAREHVQDVRKVVAELKARGRKDLT